MSLSAINQQIYNAARKLGTTIGTPTTEWASKDTSGGAGTVVGFALQGELGRKRPPGNVDVAGPESPFGWYFVKDSGTLGVGYQIAYGGYTFNVTALAVPGQATYELALADQ